MPRKIFAPLAVLAAIVLAPALAHADVITLSSHTGAAYTFDVYAADGTLAFSDGNTITLTGLSGISGVALTSTAASFGTVSYTGNSVIFTVDYPASGYSTSPLDVSLFTVTSSASSLNNVSYALQEYCTTYTGTVQNTTTTITPTAATPEPCSLLLLSSGVAATGLVRRRRRRSSGNNRDSAALSTLQPITA